jgi:hypothetical protein
VTAPFAAAAWVASGQSPRAAARQRYHVRVTPQRLQLRRTETSGAVLDVALGTFSARASGAAGACVIDLQGAPLCIDFTEYDAGGAVARAPLRRAARALRGRRARRAFLSAATSRP